ncbi:PAS domain-containing sensor histidine kinase [Spirosoma oryzicola]|uniref:PAS domain-containing sensor histidine kinase n=1 Tax=Spirosoma oryzicola TaxID=2898794 RepID=UPI001E49C633|nr:PAS domain-containing sensor histidine kinase [Spirosoma oryzicola]UHG90603.1 PAS domain-containing protein [Spirosoma oryzicola]
METNSADPRLYPFLNQKDELDQLIRSLDWSASPLGSIDTWPQSLQTTLSIVMASPLPMALLWGSECICFYNDSFRSSLDIDGHHVQALGRSLKIAFPEWWHAIEPLVNQAFGGETVRSDDQLPPIYRQEHPENVYWTLNYSPVLDESGRPGGVLITGIESQALAQLKESQAKLQLALQASELGIWVLDPLQKTVHMDARCQELYGFLKNEQVTYSDVLNHIYPEDRPRVDTTVMQTLAPGSNGQYDIKFRTLALEDNRLRWIHCQGKAHFNDQGQADRFAGTARDITEQVVTQEEQENTEEQARLAVSSAGAGTFFIDLEHDTVVCSPTLAKIFTGNELTGLTRNMLITYILPQDRPRRDKAYEEAARTGKLRYEARTTWDDGSIHWLRVMGTYLNNPAGKPTRFAGIAQDITAEVEASLEQQQFTSLVEGSPEYMSIASLDGPILYVNPYGLELLGLKKEEISSKKLSDFFTPEDWEIVLNTQIPLSISHKRWTGVQHYRNFQTGERIPLDIKRFVITDPVTGEPYALVATGRDLRPELAARKELEESEAALQKVNQRLEIALNAGHLGSYELDLTSGIMQCTPQCKANFGLPVAATLNFPDLLRIILPDDRQLVQRAVDLAIADKSTYKAEYRVAWPDGSIHWIRASGQTTYDEAGMPLTMVGITMDITVQRMAQQDLERQVQERTRDLINTNQELVRTNHELEQFAYIASHDLQEPLRKIQSFAGLLPDNRYDDELFALYLDKIMKSAQRMSALIKAVLNYSRLSKSDEQFAKTDLNQIIRHVLTDFELLIDEKKAVIQIKELPVIESIPMQLHQLFANLISNALKFAREVPVIDIASQSVPANEVEQLGLQPDATYAHLTVKDNGIGFDQQYADRVFTIFQRLNNARDYSGTGIGLALCRKIVNNHGGVISAESEPGQGATFHIYLPVSQPAKPV